MATSAIIWERAKKHCKAFKKQFSEPQGTHAGLPCLRSYAKLEIDDIFKLLDNVSYSAQRGIIELKPKLCTQTWEVMATVHAGGWGGDAELHFNIRFDPPKAAPPNYPNEQYHVRCNSKADGTVYIFDIKSDLQKRLSNSIQNN